MGTGGSKTQTQATPEVKALVTSILTNPNTNLTVVPDGMEREVDEKLLMMLLEMLHHSVESCKISVLGYDISFVIEHKPEIPKPQLVLYEKQNN